MPATAIHLYQDDDGSVPVREWLNHLRTRDRKAYANCRAAISRLGMFGHELRRPQADYLRDGIHELRIRRGHVHYRILYFFHGRNVALLTHALTKQQEVPASDLDRAVQRKRRYEQAPVRHQCQEDLDDG
jgi:phage-related protein